MKGFSGFGEGTNDSPVKAADEALVEAAKMGSDEVAETKRQMGQNIADMMSEAVKGRGNKSKDTSKDKNKDKENQLWHIK